ncbi:MAG: type VI secretion system tip protein VgrG, partial [Polyangiaceae bacterium]|nr:type VI secretion system tip protein VgrG [Polyangiaceae bacterium]
MTIDLFHLSCDALQGAALVGWKGEEGLGRPFELELFFTVPRDTDVKAALGAAATLTATRGDEREPMRWHGVLARVRLLHITAERGLYAALLVPRLWLLRHGERSYVHTKKRLGDFVTRTLEDGGLTTADYRLDIDAGSYPEEELVIQYHETHLDFVGRWLEREGPYYYFEHAPDDGGDAVMVVVDRASQHQPLPGSGKVKVRPRTGTDVSAGESFAEVTGEYRARPASVLVCDYDYGAPDAPVEGEAAVMDGGAGVERQYGYRVFDSGEAARLAGVRAASRAWQAFVLRARGNAFHLRAGYVFELEDAQPGIAATRFLAVRVRHEGAVAGATPEVRALVGLDATEPYRVEVEAIPADVQYRAPQVTPWPRLHGYENGTVDGPASSQYAQIDAEGRYLVRLKFDASSLPDGSTSTYVRMMQPHGGMLEGHHFPLRKGTEVMLGFLGGDVDRPFIAGVVPDARHPSPVTRKNQTQNVIRTGGKNHLVWEDEDKKQYINLYSPTSETTVQLGGPIEGTFGKKEAVKCTYFVTTRGNAGFEIGGSWWEDVTG